MSDKVYSITDIEGYADYIRRNVAKSFCEDYTEDLNDFITIPQTVSIIKEHTLGQNDNQEYLINEEAFDDTFEEIRTWIYGVGLSKAAGRDQIECAWDNKSNEMIFWLPKKNTSIPSKPDTYDGQ